MILERATTPREPFPTTAEAIAMMTLAAFMLGYWFLADVLDWILEQ